MRSFVGVALIAILAGLPNAVAQEALEKEQIEKWSEYHQQRVKNYSLQVLEDGTKTELVLEPTPVLRWQNPLRTTTHGECFVWTREGRVRAIASLFSYPSNNGRRVCHAFNVFGKQGLEADYDGKEFWRVAASDLPEMIRVPDSPKVAASAAIRMAQMRSIAQKFTAKSEGASNEEPQPLRLLTSPLYRYSQSNSNGVDGALFAFAMGTDPEILLLLESYEDGATSEWRFTAARHTYTSLSVSYDDMEVWSHSPETAMPTYLSVHGVDQQPSILP